MPRTTTTPPAASDGVTGQGRATPATRDPGTARSSKEPAVPPADAKVSAKPAKAAKATPAPPTVTKPTEPAAPAGTPAAKAAAPATKPSPATKAPAKAAPAAKAPAARPAAPPGRLSSRPAPAAADGSAETYVGDVAFLDEQRHALLEERATYVEQARLLRAEAESLVLEMEPGDVQFDEESGEGGTTTVDRERDLVLSAQALAAVEEIDVALEKIEKGRYGICEGCGQPIMKARLEALPFARLCIACKSGGLSRR